MALAITSATAWGCNAATSSPKPPATATPIHAPAALGEAITIKLSSPNPDLGALTLAVPKAFLDPRFPGVGEHEGHRFTVLLVVRKADAACAVNRLCQDLFKAAPRTEAMELGVRLSPMNEIARLMKGRVASGRFIFGLQFYDFDGPSAPMPHRGELSNLGQPVKPDMTGRWSPLDPPPTKVQCIAINHPGSLCSLDVEAAPRLVVATELATPDLGHWAELSVAAQRFIASMVAAP